MSSWQKKLSTVDSVISIWFEVQRTWSHLESIFIGSDDIRNQLPEDSKRFDGIDTDFKVSVLVLRSCKDVDKTVVDLPRVHPPVGLGQQVCIGGGVRSTDTFHL